MTNENVLATIEKPQSLITTAIERLGNLANKSEATGAHFEKVFARVLVMNPQTSENKPETDSCSGCCELGQTLTALADQLERNLAYMQLIADSADL